MSEYTDQTYLPPVGEGFSTDGLVDAATNDGLFDVEDAELPGTRTADTTEDVFTPDHTAARAPRAPRVGTLRERFARARAGRQTGGTSPRASRRSAPSTPRAARAPKTVRVPNRKGQFVKPLTQFYTMVGMVTTSRDAVCGPAVVANAEACARSIDDLAYTNEWLRTILWQLTQTGMLTKVFMAHSPILFAVGMHHSERFRFAIDNSGMGEFIAGMLADQAKAVRDALAEEDSNAATSDAA